MNKSLKYIYVTYTSIENKWKFRKEGNTKATKICKNRATAIREALKIAKTFNSQVVVFDKKHFVDYILDFNGEKIVPNQTEE